MKTNQLSSNMEDYMEAIAVLKKRNSVARVRDIGKLMKVKTSSVTSVLNVLSKRGLVSHERYGYVDLTENGEKLAKRIQGYHNVLAKFLTEILSINHETAGKDACRMEHAISLPTFQKLTGFMDFVATCPDGARPEWLKGFDYYFKTGRRLKCKTRQINAKLKAEK